MKKVVSLICSAALVLSTASTGFAASLGPGLKVDTGKQLIVEQGKTYQFKITALSKPRFVCGSNSVFKVIDNGSKGNDYFFKVVAIGKKGQGAGFYINDEKIPCTIGTISSGLVTLDTGKSLIVPAGKSYIFKATSTSKPSFVSGNDSVFTVLYIGSKGMDHYFKVTAVGQPKQQAGFYVNNEKVPRTIGTILDTNSNTNDAWNDNTSSSHHSSSHHSSGNNNNHQSSSATIYTAEQFKNAIQNNNIATINLNKDITGDVTAIRSGNKNFTVNFGAHKLTGNLSITANAVSTITLNGTANPKIDGNLTVSANSATVNNNIKVNSTINVKDVANNSWHENADGNTLLIDDANGASVKLNGQTEKVEIKNGAKNINIEIGKSTNLIVDKGASVNKIIADETAAGTTITNYGTVSNVTANADIAIENNGNEIPVSGSGKIDSSGSTKINGGTVLKTKADDTVKAVKEWIKSKGLNDLIEVSDSLDKDNGNANVMLNVDNIRANEAVSEDDILSGLVGIVTKELHKYDNYQIKVGNAVVFDKNSINNTGLKKALFNTADGFFYTLANMEDNSGVYTYKTLNITIDDYKLDLSIDLEGKDVKRVKSMAQALSDHMSMTMEDDEKELKKYGVKNEKEAIVATVEMPDTLMAKVAELAKGQNVTLDEIRKTFNDLSVEKCFDLLGMLSTEDIVPERYINDVNAALGTINSNQAIVNKFLTKMKNINIKGTPFVDREFNPASIKDADEYQKFVGALSNMMTDTIKNTYVGDYRIGTTDYYAVPITMTIDLGKLFKGTETVVVRMHIPFKGAQEAEEEAKSREAFNKIASNYFELKSDDGKIADVDYDADKYEATITITSENKDITSIAGTGIFSKIMPDLGVKKIKIGDGKYLDVTDKEKYEEVAKEILKELGENPPEKLYDLDGKSITFSAKIQPKGQIEFEQEFTVTFNLDDEIKEELINEAKENIKTELGNFADTINNQAPNTDPQNKLLVEIDADNYKVSFIFSKDAQEMAPEKAFEHTGLLTSIGYMVIVPEIKKVSVGNTEIDLKDLKNINPESNMGKFSVSLALIPLSTKFSNVKSTSELIGIDNIMTLHCETDDNIEFTMDIKFSFVGE